MNKPAVLVAEDLYLNMTRFHDQLFEVNLVAPERGKRLAAPGRNHSIELIRTEDNAHAPAATAPRGFEHQRVADPACGVRCSCAIIW